MKQTIFNYVANQRGATAVEFAIIGPLFTAMIIGTLELGVFFLGTHEAQRATEAAAREIRMMDMPAEEQISAVLDENVNVPISGTYVQSVAVIQRSGVQFADIKVTYTYNLHIPFLDQFPLTAETRTQINLRQLEIPQ